MNLVASGKGIALLIIGDLVAYIFSLVLTLAIRYGSVPSKELLFIHAPAFAVLILVFVLINFSGGLYDKQISLTGGRIRGLLFRVQVVNAVVGITFFYFAPVAIAPKANLFIYFAVSTALLFLWRLIMFPVLSASKKQSSILVGAGEDIDELHDEMNMNIRYSLDFRERIMPRSDVKETVSAIAQSVKRTGATIIVADLHNPIIEAAMPYLYTLIFSGVQVIDAGKLYESIFDRISLSMIQDRWFVENSSSSLGNRRVYDGLKRLIDIAVSLIGGVISLVFYPFVYIAIKLEDRGPIFIEQTRVGKNGRLVKIYKFRSMTGNDDGKYGKNGSTSNAVTRVGLFMRRSRIDELPQFWNVLRGDLSMVGPRPELPNLASVYEEQIPYYNGRHLVKPGLFGWAQIYHEAHPHHSVSTEDTRDKLSYDLFYVKNRSLALDLKITLRTMQILMKRAGR